MTLKLHILWDGPVDPNPEMLERLQEAVDELWATCDSTEEAEALIREAVRRIIPYPTMSLSSFRNSQGYFQNYPSAPEPNWS